MNIDKKVIMIEPDKVKCPNEECLERGVYGYCYSYQFLLKSCFRNYYALTQIEQ